MLKNCPSPFYRGCLNAMKKCKSCRAGMGSSSAPLFYKPSKDSPDVTEHPAYKLNKEHSLRIRKARKWEKKEAKQLGAPTSNSGATYNDGDAKRWMGDREIRIELKDRGSRKSFSLGLDEYLKGRRQGIEAFGITIKDSEGRRHTVYLVEDKLFKELTEEDE